TPEADIRAVRFRARVGERVRIVDGESEAAVVGRERRGIEPVALPGLQLHPRVRALAQRQIRALEAAAVNARVVGAGGDTETDVVVEPHVSLAARRPGVEILEGGRVLV